jgi:flagellar biosynthesis protein FlhF
MKIKRFFAPDIRQAMRMVKEELGADAVIMSNKSVDGGVEIVAARDFDEQLIQNRLQKQAAEQQGSGETKKINLPDFEAEKNRLHLLSSERKQSADGFLPERASVRSQRFPAEQDTNARPNRFSVGNDAPTIPGDRRKIDPYVGYAEKVHLRGNLETVTAKSAGATRPSPIPMNSAVQKATQIVRLDEKPSNPPDSLLLEMSKELKSLRSEMDSKLSQISWGGVSQANPVRAELLQRLEGMSISKKLSTKIANRFANHTDTEQVFSQAQELLAKLLPVADVDLLEYGGIVALVGPTGVGKTTTIAKLAANFILKHGPRQVALITTDNYRIGAHEQLNTYGRILDVPVRVASSAAELRNLINGFADKRLILIDTAGMSQRDMKLVEQINTLQQSGQVIKSYLVMSAATEYKAMNEIIKAFQVVDPQASILTKFDEAATIGSAISSIIEHNLPLAFIANGQQVPEDMYSPCARTLVAQCVAELERENDYNDINNEAWAAQGYA